MTNPIKNNQVPPPSTDPYAKNYGTGGPEPDPYGDSGYDPGMGGDDYGMDGGYEDEFIGDDYEGGDETGGAPIGGYSVADLREMVTSMKGTLSADQNASFMGRINASAGMSPEKQEAELAKIAGELNMIANPAQAGIEGELGTESEGAGLAEQLKSELEAMKERIEDDEKIPSDIKSDLKREVEKLIAKCDVDLSEVKEQNIREKMEELEGEIEEARNITEGAKNLEGVTGKTAKEIQEIAASKGIDLNNLPKPPTPEVMEFLCELIPDLKAALQTAKDAVGAKAKMDEDKVNEARRISTGNAASTTDCDSDRSNFAVFKYLLAAQTHTDEGSKKMAEAFSAFTTKLAENLKLLYPDVTITAVGSSFDDCDLINFDNQKLDVLSNKEGNIISSTSLTEDAELPLPEMVVLEYDWEGDGDYEDVDDGNALKWLQQQGYPTHCYD